MNIKTSLTTLVAATLSIGAHAQTSYRAIDLTAPGTPSAANGISGGVAVGTLGTHAASFAPDGSIAVLHPAFLDTATTLGRSSIAAQDGGVQVGSGVGSSTNGRLAAIAWSGSAESATLLPLPFLSPSSQANAISGNQIVGQAYPFSDKRDLVGFGPAHPLLWDATTGAVTDLFPGGNGSVATGVGGGKQVGYDFKTLATAVMWSGTAKSMVSLHPVRDYDLSVATATDGISQVGYAGLEVQIFLEKRGRRVRFTHPALWHGTAASFQTLNFFGFRDAYALGVSGDTIVGYGAIGVPTGAISAQHAVSWTGPNHDLNDLHSSLPAGYVSSTASGVDAQGNISGTATTASGERHAIVWVPLP